MKLAIARRLMVDRQLKFIKSEVARLPQDFNLLQARLCR